MRRSRGTLTFCVLSIAIGVLSIAAIRSLSDSLQAGLNLQARKILGADLRLSSRAPLTGEVAAGLTRELRDAGARDAGSVRFLSMLERRTQRAADRSTLLVRVRAVGDGFPFYGRIDTRPPMPFARLAEQPSLVVDPGVAAALGLQPGDVVKLGQLEATVLGEFSKQPGSPAAEFSMAPYVFLHERFLHETKLLSTGSRVTYERLFALPDGVSAEAWKRRHFEQSLDARVELRTSRESAANVRRFTRRLSGFTTVVGLVTLLLGALGAASGMHTFMAGKLDHAAVLRCVGAKSRQVFLIYALVVARVGAWGAVLGAGAALLLLPALGGVARSLGAGFLPTELSLRASPSALLHGMGAGLLSASAFALLPVLRMAGVPPLRVLGRRETAVAGGARRRLSLAALAALLSVFGLSATQAESLSVGLFFTLSIGVALLALAGLSRLVVSVARRGSARLKSFHLRQGIANLHRPGNQTQSVIIAVGTGFLLMGTLLIVQRSLEKLLEFERDADLPNLFAIDVQPDQVPQVREAFAGAGARTLAIDPMISARIAGVNGKPVDTSEVERDAGKRTWQQRMRTREYFVSYRSQLLSSETLEAGRFWTSDPGRQEASLDHGLADSLGVRLGDTLSLDVQGVVMSAVVTSFRRIDWLALRPNSMVLLSPGDIEKAPGMFVASARVEGQEARRQLQNALVAAHPNLSIIDATEAAQTVLSIVEQVSRVFGLLGLVAVLIGAVVVAGAIAAGRFARRREAMLLRVLGASRADLRRILAAEYGLLALLGVACGWALAEALNRAAVASLFDAPPVVPYEIFVPLGLGVIVLNTAVGLVVGRGTARATPLSVLREAD